MGAAKFVSSLVCKMGAFEPSNGRAPARSPSPTLRLTDGFCRGHPHLPAERPACERLRPAKGAAHRFSMRRIKGLLCLRHRTARSGRRHIRLVPQGDISTWWGRRRDNRPSPSRRKAIGRPCQVHGGQCGSLSRRHEGGKECRHHAKAAWPRRCRASLTSTPSGARTSGRQGFDDC